MPKAKPAPEEGRRWTPAEEVAMHRQATGMALSAAQVAVLKGLGRYEGDEEAPKVEPPAQSAAKAPRPLRDFWDILEDIRAHAEYWNRVAANTSAAGMRGGEHLDKIHYAGQLNNLYKDFSDFVHAARPITGKGDK